MSIEERNIEAMENIYKFVLKLNKKVQPGH